MRNRLIVLGFAAATLIPSFAAAQQSCEERGANRTAGTVVGAGVGALVGSAVAGHGDRGTGAVIGGVGGAVLGNQLAKGNGDCRHAYGYYDNNGNWRANDVSRNDAQGYYDRNGNWIAGAPEGRWDGNGRWVAASANGYGDNVSYGASDAPRDVRQRLDWLYERVRRGRGDGSLSPREADRALTDLDQVQRQERRMSRRNGGLNDRDQAYLQARLDSISSQLRWSRRN
ncbi:glycine zipper 2TM domain-containing protein [Phenylobacterium sp.]|jgi:uncharacterized protein YcfJ|uniref:glycine zipper 2TM domain-containing protein n=1 Tax=Phenylobacterium sp. TaxID=1871053 RepID=UPI002F3FC85A